MCDHILVSNSSMGCEQLNAAEAFIAEKIKGGVRFLPGPGIDIADFEDIDPEDIKINLGDVVVQRAKHEICRLVGLIKNKSYASAYDGLPCSGLNDSAIIYLPFSGEENEFLKVVIIAKVLTCCIESRAVGFVPLKISSDGDISEISISDINRIIEEKVVKYAK